MRKFLTVTAVLAFATVAATAFAAGMMKTGTIKTWDPKTHMLGLDTGDTFVVPKSWKPGHLKAGSKVTVTYVEKGGMMDATKIVAAH